VRLFALRAKKRLRTLAIRTAHKSHTRHVLFFLLLTAPERSEGLLAVVKIMLLNVPKHSSINEVAAKKPGLHSPANIR